MREGRKLDNINKCAGCIYLFYNSDEAFHRCMRETCVREEEASE